MKNLFFLSGLQRSGATLLSSILNQNPSILATPASPLFRMMSSAYSTFGAAENIDYDKNDSIARSMMAIPQAFYSDSTADNVIDKNLNWQTPAGLSLITAFITDNPKIICPVRSIPEILASFDAIISAHKENANNTIDEKVNAETIPVGNFADRRAEWLMRYDKDIPICLNGMKLALNPDLKNVFLFIEYQDLVDNTQKQIERIYEFLGIAPFDHEYQNIVDPTGISEQSPVTKIKHLHKVRPKIEKRSPKPEDILSPEIIRRYSGLEFWRELT